MNKTEIFIEKAKNIHNEKYDYSLVEYENNHTKVKIVCYIHGIFEQSPIKHLNQKQDCPYCANNIKFTNEKFISISKESKGEIEIDKYLETNNIKLLDNIHLKIVKILEYYLLIFIYQIIIYV
jgi:hypothetical protein